MLQPASVVYKSNYFKENSGITCSKEKYILALLVRYSKSSLPHPTIEKAEYLPEKITSSESWMLGLQEGGLALVPPFADAPTSIGCGCRRDNSCGTLTGQ
jgi:hypothetical protein